MPLRLPITFDADPQLTAAARIAAELAAHGYAAYLVGGAVRDRLAGYRPKDVDLVSSATPTELKALFPELRDVGASFGVGLLPIDSFAIEIATMREERSYLDGRHPEQVRYTTEPAIDAERRDFTVNALFYDPANGEVIDFVGGINDIERGVIRTVGDPERRFREDYLRMLRAVRFAARLNYEIAPDTAAAIRRLAPLAAELSGERIRCEIAAMLTGPAPRRAMELLAGLGLLAAVLPEVAALRGVEQPPEFHPEGDVFVHTLTMLDHMFAATPELAWSVLLHDVGKAPCRFVDAAGRVRFFGHEVRGAEIAGDILSRLRFSNAESELIRNAVRNHMAFAHVREMRPATRRKLLGRPGFALELELNRLDCVGSHGLLEPYLMLLDEVDQLAGTVELPPPLLSGRELLELGFTAGPGLGAALRRIFDAQLGGEITDRDAALKLAGEILSRERL